MTKTGIKSIMSVIILLLFLSGCTYKSAVHAARVYYQEGKIEKLEEILDSKDPYGREEAINLLSELSKCETISRMKDGKDYKVRAALAKGLGKCNNETALNVLIVLLKDVNPLVRKNSIESTIGNDYCKGECFFAMRRLLEDPDPFVRLSAGKALYKRFPQECHSIFLDSLSSKIQLVRQEAIKCLELFENPDDIYYLGEFLQDQDTTIKIAARERSKGQAAIPQLFNP